MKVKYFPDTDTAHVEFINKKVYETKEISENLYIYLDKDGNVINITIEHAKSNTDLWEFSYQEMVTQKV